MILASAHEVKDGNELAAKALELFGTPTDLIGQTLFVNWREEALFDSVAGMFWPSIMVGIVADAYKGKGHEYAGFSASMTFPDDEGCLLTFDELALHD